MQTQLFKHNGQMTQKCVELQDGRIAVVDYRLVTAKPNHVMAAIKIDNRLGDFQPLNISKIKTGITV